MVPPGQLQQENSPVQFWQSEQSEHPCEHQRLNVDHWHHQDRRSRPRVHPQVSPGAWMVSDIIKHKMIRKDWLNKWLAGTTTGSNTSTWKRHDHKMLSPWKMFTGSGFPFLSLITLRRTRQPRYEGSPTSWEYNFQSRGRKTRSWRWRGKVTL